MGSRRALSLICTAALLGLRSYSSWWLPSLAASVESTETQPASPSDAFPPGEMPTTATWPQFLSSARQTTLAYSHALPDFICTQNTKRMAKFGGTGNWTLVDQIVAEVSYRENKEHYRISTIDNKPPSREANRKIPGFSSEGDFGNALYLLFAPQSNASFQMEGPDHIRGRKTVRAHFYVSQSNSRFHIGLGSQTVTTAYGGHCWIDVSSRQVIRLESEAMEIPASMPVRMSLHSTDYDLVEISGKKYWLPVRASVHLQLVNEPSRRPIDFSMVIYGKSYGIFYPVLEARNSIEYKHYRKFGTEVRLLPE